MKLLNKIFFLKNTSRFFKKKEAIKLKMIFKKLMMKIKND